MYEPSRGDGDPDEFTPPWEICSHQDIRVRPVVEYEDKYLVTADGRIFSKTRTERAYANFQRTRRGRWLHLAGKTYKQVELTNRKRLSVHRLVAKTFIPNPMNKPHVNHIDSNPSHNCVSNLEWCTQSENVLHSVRFGYGLTGEDKPGAKLNWDKVGDIRRLRKEGITQQELAKKYGVSKRTISFIDQNKHWKEVNYAPF